MYKLLLIIIIATTSCSKTMHVQEPIKSTYVHHHVHVYDTIEVVNHFIVTEVSNKTEVNSGVSIGDTTNITTTLRIVKCGSWGGGECPPYYNNTHNAFIKRVWSWEGLECKQSITEES